MDKRPRIICERHYVCIHCCAPVLDASCPRCGGFEAKVVRVVRMDDRPAAVQHALERSAEKANRRRFTGEPITGFGDLTP